MLRLGVDAARAGTSNNCQPTEGDGHQVRRAERANIRLLYSQASCLDHLLGNAWDAPVCYIGVELRSLKERWPSV